MSIPASLTFFKDGKKVASVPATASYGCRTGLEHIKGYLWHFDEAGIKDLITQGFLTEEILGWDGVSSSLDGQTYYKTGEGLLANEVINDD